MGATTTNLLLTLDVSGSMSRSANSSGETRFEIAQQSLISTIEAYQAMGDTEVNLTLFASDATNVGWMDAADAIEYLNNLSFQSGNIRYNGSWLGIGNRTDYMDALNATETVDFSGHAADQTIAYFLSDGDPNDNSGAVNQDSDPTIQDWKEFIDGNDAGLEGMVDKLFVIGIGENVSDEYLEHVQVQEGEEPIIVSDETQLLDTLTDTASASVSGDVSDNNSGGDGVITIDSITLYGETYTADGQGGTTLFPNEGVALDGQGVLKFNFADGTYSYSVQSGEFTAGSTVKQFSVTVSDQDGSEASFSVTINVDVQDMDTAESGAGLRSMSMATLDDEDTVSDDTGDGEKTASDDTGEEDAAGTSALLYDGEELAFGTGDEAEPVADKGDTESADKGEASVKDDELSEDDSIGNLLGDADTGLSDAPDMKPEKESTGTGEAAADTGGEAESAAESGQLNGGSAEDADEGESLALHEVLPEEDSVDSLLGESDGESSAPSEGTDSGTGVADATGIASIDTGVNLDNLTGGQNNTPDM